MWNDKNFERKVRRSKKRYVYLCDSVVYCYHYSVALQYQGCRYLDLNGKNLVKMPSKPDPVWLVALPGGPVEEELCESPRVWVVSEWKSHKLLSRTIMISIETLPTSVAPSKRSFNTDPTRRNGGMTFQQVLSSHDPETPWHLHSTFMLWRIAWKRNKKTVKNQNTLTVWFQPVKNILPSVPLRYCECSLVAVPTTCLLLSLARPRSSERAQRRTTGYRNSLTTGNLDGKREGYVIGIHVFFLMWICYYKVLVLTLWADPSDLTVTATSFQLSPATASSHGHGYCGGRKSMDKSCLSGA